MVSFHWFCMSLFLPSVLGHGFIKLGGIKGQTLSRAQKTDLGSTFFRGVSDNTGWVGSDHLNSAAIACGMSDTPFGTDAAPSGTVFASAGQSAGKTLTMKAGSTFTLVVSGNPGVGWPHRNGDVATYLGFCGESATACQNFDASTAEFFKIQEVPGGIQDKLIPAYDGSVDGNHWDIPIPQNIKSGSYILRYELITFGQSSAAEGHQDQYYPFCAQINVQGGTAQANKFATIKFPGGYKNGNINAANPPGPQALAAGAGESSNSSGESSSQNGSSTKGSAKGSSKGSGSDSSCGAGHKHGKKRSKRHGKHHGRGASAMKHHGKHHGRGSSAMKHHGHQRSTTSHA